MTRKLSRIVISSVSEKSLSFATKQAMFGTLKRETFYPLPFGHRPIYIRGEAATFISNSSFEQSFHSESRDGTPRGLILNPILFPCIKETLIK